MKRICLFLSVLVVSLATISCEKITPEKESEFANEVTLGLGVTAPTYQVLFGESDTFYLEGSSLTLYIRVESESDMAGRTIYLDFKKGGSLINTISRPNVQSYGHVQASSFEWFGGKGDFVVEAYYLENNEKELIDDLSFSVL